MTSYTPITAFNLQFGVDFTVAYKWSATQIFTFLSNVAANPAAYGAPQTQQAVFQQLYANIYALRSPDGPKFTTPTPAQHLLRTTTAVDPIGPIAWSNEKAERFFILFDLLGIFLSLMGAPTTIETLTATTYCLPLVTLYGKWCSVLAQSKKFTPTVAQITWGTGVDGKAFYPFLGASAAGFPQKDQTWKENVRKARWGYLQGILKTPYNQYGYSPLRGPVGEAPEKMKQAGTNFGNCGETYPFLYVLADICYVSHSYGIALRVASAADQTDYNGQDLWKLGPMMAPCENCAQLLTWYGVTDQSRFQLYPAS